MEKNSENFLSACFTVNEDGNGKYLGTIVILKARGVRKSLFCVSAPKEMEGVNVRLPRVGRAVYYHCFLTFPPLPWL